jgi:hypothetical protein
LVKKCVGLNTSHSGTFRGGGGSSRTQTYVNIAVILFTCMVQKLFMLFSQGQKCEVSRHFWYFCVICCLLEVLFKNSVFTCECRQAVLFEKETHTFYKRLCILNYATFTKYESVYVTL